MKGADHQHLRAIVERFEEKRKMNELGTALLSILGLIGFGIMLIPVWGLSPRQAPVATTVATSTPAVSTAFVNVHLIGQSAVVYDLATGHVLYEKNGTAALPLASLTKLLTTYAAVTTLSGATPITITDKALAEDGDSGLTLGETFALNDLARFELVASSNDAAAAIAEATMQKQSETNQNMMANVASALGLMQTRAVNGTGLDVSTTEAGGYGSAEDVARLAGGLLAKAPTIASATIEPRVTVRSLQGTVHTLPNTNQGIVHLPGALLSKTGYTDLAGGNLVEVFDVGLNHPIAVVVLGSTKEGRFADVNMLVARTLDHFAGTNP